MSAASQRIQSWPEESREAAQLVINRYGEPDELSDTQLLWHRRGKWKRIVASKAFYKHDFPAPHIDAVECVVDYRVPVDKFSALAEFDGSAADPDTRVFSDSPTRTSSRRSVKASLVNRRPSAGGRGEALAAAATERSCVRAP